MQVKPAHSMSRLFFFSTCIYFQEHKCVFFSWFPFCLLPSSFHWIGLPAQLHWVVFPWMLPAVSLPTFCLCALSHSWGSSHPLCYSQDQLWIQHWFGFLPALPAYHFLLLPISIYVSLASVGRKELKFNIYSIHITDQAGTVLNSLHTYYNSILTASL